MSADEKPPAPARPAARADADSKPAARPAAKPAAQPPALDERPLKFADLAPFAAQLDAGDLVASLRDGRGVVRANAALGLAAVGQAALDLVLLLRDSEIRVAAAAAEALGLLGIQVREQIPQITQTLDGAQPEVLEAMVGTLAALVGKADDELGLALDVPLALAMKTVIEACGRLDRAGIAFLIQATRHERSRVRINAIGGLGRWGKTDIEASMACLTQIEANDPVPDVRTAAKQASLAVIARTKVEVVDGLPKNIPDFEDRKLGASELAEYADQIHVDEMIYALRDGRAHVRINGCRALGVKGAAATRAVPSLGLACRDSAAQVRREAAKALGKLGDEALAAAADLVGALSDVESDVADAAAEALEPLGAKAADALVRGLATGSETGGWRVGEVISKLPDAAELLTEAFRSPAVNVQVNAALGLGMLGKARVGAGLPALLGARTGGDARTRDAVRRALEMINPSGQTGPSAVQIDGFEDRFLAASEIEASKAELQRIGVGDLLAHLQDGRDVVRANAAAGLGALGPAAAPAAATLGVRLRDDAPRVRLAAAQALDKLGDAAVVETAGDLVRALGDAEDKVAEACAAVIRARKGRMIGALVRGLETDNPAHGRRIAELLGVFDDATDILCDAFESPAVNVQVNAAIGLGMLGPKRVGKGRKALEGARTGGDVRTREAVRKALDMLDGPRNQGPQEIQIEGFEARVLGPEAFANAAGKLPAAELVNYLHDGRAHVRANAATALGTLGPAVAGAAIPLGVLMRDDDMKVRIQAAWALDKLGDDAVRAAADYLVGALRGDAEVGRAVAPVLAARKGRVLSALLKGLETDDDAHARRILEVINVLPDAPEILCDAIESPAENVQVNAAIGIGMLGEKRAGSAGRKALETRRTGGFARTREAVFKALAMWRG
ncbi:MAG TPA: HEAT repeat domain-containing protein [Kofleriaceae bacterium]|jgi:HEAT repeat protein|nr:HEAT repeat domain-containing protein [Kofleriaceae bacterium]